FVVMALLSFFWSASLPLVEATTLSHLGDSAASYGRVRLWGSVGFIIAVIGIGYVLDVAEVRTLLWLVLGLMTGIVIFSRHLPEAESVTHHTDRYPARQILKRPEVAALFASCFLMAAAHGPYYTFYSLYLVEHDYSKSAIGWLWALGVICEIAVFIGMPRLMQRFSLPQILGASFLLAVIRFLLIGWLVDSVAAILFAQMLHAATFGSYHAAAVAAIHHFFRGRHQAKGQALYTSLTFGAGGTFGALMSGYAWDFLGASLTFSMASLFALLGLILIGWKFRLKT
ncbi:MAG: MFS transporter, partial [Burkholderiales bacterium]